MTRILPAGSRSCRGSRPRAAAHQRTSGRSHSKWTDPSTITSPTARSRTQISPGIHGAARQTIHHNHSPPPLTRARIQISDSAFDAFSNQLTALADGYVAGVLNVSIDKNEAFEPRTLVNV
jgi:hypothetical protein